MKIEVNPQEKLAMFWLTNAEQRDTGLQAQIRQKTAEYQKQKYTVAVFHSGKNDLRGTFEGLLLHNQKALVHKELERCGAVCKHVAAWWAGNYPLYIEKPQSNLQLA